MSAPNLSIVPLLLQSVLKTEESSEEVLAIVIFHFHVEVLHIEKTLCCFNLYGTGIKMTWV